MADKGGDSGCCTIRPNALVSVDVGNGFLRSILGETWLLGANVFFDAATGFDSDKNVIGQPGVARDKPGEGLGYGSGFVASSTFGLVRLDFIMDVISQDRRMFNQRTTNQPIHEEII